MSKTKINDGLTKWQRYRLKDIDAYRTKKRNYARTSEERAKRIEYSRQWREKNRDKYNAWARENHQKNRHKYRGYARASYFLKTYGITVDQREDMIEAQNYKCKICAKEFKSQKNTHLDHCHKTGRIRGILCGLCNSRLGWYETNTQSILDYLK